MMESNRFEEGIFINKFFVFVKCFHKEENTQKTRYKTINIHKLEIMIPVHAVFLPLNFLGYFFID